MIRTSIGFNSAGKIFAAFWRQSPIFFPLQRPRSPVHVPITFAADVKFDGVLFLGNFVSQKLKFLAKLENFSSSLCQFRRLAINDLNMFHFFSSQLLILSAQMTNTLVVRLKEWQRDGRLLYLKWLGSRLQRAFGAFSILNLENIFDDLY